MAGTISWEVQGHRGARGLLPENTLPSFEIALDLGVTSIETDVHLTKDDEAVLFHDPRLTDRLCSARPGHAPPDVATQPLVRSLTLTELRGYRIGGPALPATLLAAHFARERNLDPYGIPTIGEFLEFALAYAGPIGAELGKTATQRERAGRLWIDLELKRVPFTPETIGDGFDGTTPALLERTVVTALRQAGLVNRARVRSFDHRSVRALRRLEPALATGLLVHQTALAEIGKILEAGQADLFCPDYEFVDAEIVHQVHAAGKRILPYTVNEPNDWARLLDWGVDGVTTDYPDRLLQWLADREVGVL